MPRNKNPAVQLKELQDENEALKRELAQLQHSGVEKNGPNASQGNTWKKIGAVASIIMATALLVAGNLLFWAGNTIIDPQRFNAIVSPLIKTPEIQQALSHYVSEQLFARVNVQQILEENLPERIAFAAPALAGQVESATQTALTRITQNESFQQTWNSTIESAHARFINFLQNYQGDGTIELSEVYDRLVAQLPETRFGLLSKVQLPEQAGSITLVDASWLPFAHNVANNIWLYRILATVLCIGCIALAIWLSRRRRRTAITIGVIFAIFMVVTLIAIRITQQQLVANVVSDYQPAARVVSESLLQSLILQTRVLFVIGIVIALVAWVSGPYKSATLMRSRIELLFGGNIHDALFGRGENAVTRWTGDHKRLIQWGLTAIAALVIVLSPLNMTTMLIVLAALIVALLVVEIIAAPKRTRKGAVQGKA